MAEEFFANALAPAIGGRVLPPSQILLYPTISPDRYGKPDLGLRDYPSKHDLIPQLAGRAVEFWVTHPIWLDALAAVTRIAKELQVRYGVCPAPGLWDNVVYSQRLTTAAVGAPAPRDRCNLASLLLGNC